VGVVIYQVYSGSTLVGTSTSTSATVMGLTSNTTYSFTVRAADAAGNVSDASTQVQVSTYTNCALGCSGNSSEP